MPFELILDIVDNLDPQSLISLAFAYYPLVQRVGLAPAMSTSELATLFNRSKLPSMLPLVSLPAELLLQVMRLLSPMDLMRFALANYQGLVARRLAPRLTDDIFDSLLEACYYNEGRS